MKFFSISVVGFKIFYKIDSLVKQKRLCTDWAILFWSFPSLCIFCLPLLLSGQEQGWVHHWLLKKIKNQILFDPIIYIEDIEKNLQEKQRVSDYFIIIKKTYKCCVNIFYKARLTLNIFWLNNSSSSSLNFFRMTLQNSGK